MKRTLLLVTLACFVSFNTFAGSAFAAGDLCKSAVRKAVAAKIRAEKGAKADIGSIDVTRDADGNGSYSVDVEVYDNAQEGPQDGDELQYTATTAIAGGSCGILSLTQTYGQ